MIARGLLLCIFLGLAAAANEDQESLIDMVFGGDHEVHRRGTPDACVCVPYYLCVNETVLTDGRGLLDIRIKELRSPLDVLTRGKNLNDSCVEYMDVCCQNPGDPTDIPKPVPLVRRGCGQRNPEGVAFKIIGDVNKEAQFGEFPWMIALLKETVADDGSVQLAYHCGGALIHEAVVLTTAHCVTRNISSPRVLTARGGEWDSRRANEIYPHQDRGIARIITHPNFGSGNLWNDFSLLVLDKPFVLSSHIDTVCLSPPGPVPLSKECFASGWGKDKFGQDGQYQAILKKIELPIVAQDQCNTLIRKTRLGPFFKLHESFICAGGNGKDTCTGDGGSPLVCPIEGKPGTYRVTGLVAWGIGCGDETPGVYARVAHARGWIDGVMTELGYQTE